MNWFRHHKKTIGAVFGGALTVLAVMLFTGLLGFGCSQYTVTQSRGASSKAGGGMGSGWLYLKQGQQLFVNYDATIRDGSLNIYVRKSANPLADVRYGTHRIKGSEKGQWVFIAPEAGFYSVDITGSVIGGKNGYDISYSANWRSW